MIGVFSIQTVCTECRKSGLRDVTDTVVHVLLVGISHKEKGCMASFNSGSKALVG